MLGEIEADNDAEGETDGLILAETDPDGLQLGLTEAEGLIA